MIVPFEEALVNTYIPYLHPVKKVIMSTESDRPDMTYFNDKFDSYPIAYVTRSSFSDSALCARYQYTDSDTHLTCFPFQVTYDVLFIFEKESEALQALYSIRVNHSLNPYVSFPYQENLKYNIGLRFLKGETRSERSNVDEKGAKRLVSVQFLTNLVISRQEKVSVFKDFDISIKPSN